MTLICFASQKGSPGTTLTALATAAAWQPAEGRRKLFLEADPDGGVLAVRYQLGLDPGLVTLAAAVRSGAPSATFIDHAQHLPGGLPAIVCPDSGEQVSTALDAAATELGAALAADTGLDVIADLGRLRAGSSALKLATSADAVLMVCRPTAELLQSTAHRMQSLRATVSSLGWVLVGDGPHQASEIEATYGFRVAATIPSDARSAAILDGESSPRRLQRTPLVRSAASLAANLQAWLQPAPPRGPEQLAALVDEGLPVHGAVGELGEVAT